MTFLASLRPPRNLPEPDRNCKTFDEAGRAQLIRNHDAMFRMSRDFHGSPPAETPSASISSPDRRAATFYNTPV